MTLGKSLCYCEFLTFSAAEWVNNSAYLTEGCKGITLHRKTLNDVHFVLLFLHFFPLFFCASSQTRYIVEILYLSENRAW